MDASVRYQGGHKVNRQTPTAHERRSLGEAYNAPAEGLGDFAKRRPSALLPDQFVNVKLLCLGNRRMSPRLNILHIGAEGIARL